MQRPHRAITSAILLSVLALAGCGTGSSASTTPKSSGKISKVSFTSTAIDPANTKTQSIPALYTCDGKNISPPLTWGHVPASTGELVLFVLGLTPLPGTNSVTVSVEWAMAGINPALHHLAAGELPQGAHPGVDTNHKHSYSICPKRGQAKEYIFELYGLPEGDAVPLNFSGLRVLSTLAISSHETIANAHGEFSAIYKRS